MPLNCATNLTLDSPPNSIPAAASTFAAFELTRGEQLV